MNKVAAMSYGVSAMSALALSGPLNGQGLPPGVGCERVAYGGWENCVRLSNSEVELIATIDVGPRIIRLGFTGDRNEFAEYKDMMGKTGGDEWRIYGGHRLWHAPEVKPRTYYPDNAPVEWSIVEGALQLTPPPEADCGIQKQILVTLEGRTNRVRLVHRITNKNQWPVELAPWSLSVMAPGGRAIIPQEPFQSHEGALLPARPMVLWFYTNMADPRWTWGSKYIQLRQDAAATTPQKLGARISNGWAAYVSGDHVFVKRFPLVDEAKYPDFGCNAEFFTNAVMLEMESLGPLGVLQPGETVEHVEVWSLHRGVDVGTTDEDIGRALSPLVK